MNETNAAREMRLNKDKAACDAAMKRLLSNKSILACIMSYCLDEYKGYSIDEIADKYIENEPYVGEVGVHSDETNVWNDSEQIYGMKTEDKTRTEGTVTYDVLFYASVPETNNRIGLIINVEAQKSYYPGYPIIKRGIYYCSRMLSAQYGREFTGSNYGELKKVYSIWICTNTPDNMVNEVDKYEIQKLVLQNNPRFKNIIADNRAEYDLMSVIMICFNNKLLDDTAGIVRMLQVLISPTVSENEKKKTLSSEYGIRMTREFEKEVSEMCNVSEGIFEQGLQIGEARGEARGEACGEARGEARGEQKKSVAIATKMVKKHCTISDIIELTELSREQIVKIADELNIQLEE